MWLLWPLQPWVSYFFDTVSVDLEDAVAFAYRATFPVRNQVATGREKQKPQHDVSTTEEVERSYNDNEESGEASETEEGTASDQASGWMILASAVLDDLFVVFFFPYVEVELSLPVASIILKAKQIAMSS